MTASSLPNAESLLQNYLIAQRESLTAFLKQNNLSAALSMHVSPDMSWFSIEHDHHIEPATDGQTLEFMERKPPACHVTLVKI